MFMEKDIVFKNSWTLNSFSGISFLLLHDHFNFLVPQKMVNTCSNFILMISNKGNLIGDATALVFLYHAY